MSRLKIVFLSAPDRDDLYPEIWLGDEVIGEASYRDGELILRLYPNVDVEVSDGELEDLLIRLRREFPAFLERPRGTEST